MEFNMLYEFTIGFAFGSFGALYLVILVKMFPEIRKALRSLRLPASWR